MRWKVFVVSVGVVNILGPLQAGRGTIDGPNDFSFLEPWFAVQQGDREKLAQRGVVVRALPGGQKHVSILAACTVSISPSRFVARVRAAEDVERSQLVAGRFGDPPVLDDLSALSLDQGDLDRLRQCRPGDCALNLAKEEMSAVQVALARATGGSSLAGQQAFRRVVLDRVARYLSGGLEALPEYQDRREPVRPAAIFADIVERSPYLTHRVPGVAAYLQQFPFGHTDGTESFLHWSKVMINNKAVVMVNHVGIFQPAPGHALPTVLVAGKQVFASRYMNGELTLTMLFAGAGASSSYLVHVERADLDTLAGSFAGLKRAVLEGRIKAEAEGGLAKLRDRLERGS